MKLPSDSFSTMNVSLYGASPGIPDLPPSASVTVAPGPACMRSLGRLRIVDHAGGGARRAVAHQRAQHTRGVGIATGAGIVLGIGDDDRPLRAFRKLHRKPNAFVGRIDLAVEIVFMACDDVGDLVRRRVRIGLCPAIGEHARPAIGEIRGRKSRRKGQCRHRLALQRRELFINTFGRLVVAALPADRDQERQLPERLGETLLCLQRSARWRAQARPVSAMSTWG